MTKIVSLDKYLWTRLFVLFDMELGFQQLNKQHFNQDFLNSDTFCYDKPTNPNELSNHNFSSYVQLGCSSCSKEINNS